VYLGSAYRGKEPSVAVPLFQRVEGVEPEAVSQAKRLLRPPSNLWGIDRPITAVHLARMGFTVLPTHYPIRTGEHPACSCGRHYDDPKRIGKSPDGRPGWCPTG
jgi:hypothetical protein